MKKKPKNYYVTITHQYLLEAFDDVEAILRAKERFMGRPNDVYFDGMTINATITKRNVPRETIKERKFELVSRTVLREYLPKKEVKHVKPIIARDRQDSKEQDYIHFSAADGV